MTLLFRFKNYDLSLKKKTIRLDNHTTYIHETTSLLAHHRMLDGWFWSKDIGNEDDKLGHIFLHHRFLKTNGP